jgi:hypothetical protein
MVFCLAPLTLFWWLSRFSDSPGYAFVATAAYVLTAPAQLLVPDGAFSWLHLWDARRIYLSFSWDETPHYAALLFLPAAMAFLDSAVLTGNRLALAGATAAASLMLLSSAFGLTALALALPAWWCSLERPQRARAIAVSAGVLAAALLLVSPWFPPSLWLAIRRNAAARPDTAWNAASSIELAIVAAGFLLLHWAVRRARADRVLHFLALFTWTVSSIAMFHQYAGWHFLPQAGRYKVEMDLAWPLLIVFAARPLLRRCPKTIHVVLCLALFALAWRQTVSHRRYAKVLLQPSPFEKTIEHRAARWLEQHRSAERAMLPGSMAQWANAASNVPQFRGGSYPTAFNPVQQISSESVYWQPRADVAFAWMQAFAVTTVAVPGPSSPEFWKVPYPRAFEGKLNVLWREDDTAIYEVPHRTRSLARVVPTAAMVRTAPRDQYDVHLMLGFAAALQDPAMPPAEFRWIDANRARLRLKGLAAGQAVSIAINYHPGWRAYSSGVELPLHADGLGLIWLESAALSAPSEIELVYNGGLEAKLMPWCAAIVLAAGLYFIAMRDPVRDSRAKRARSTT